MSEKDTPTDGSGLFKQEQYNKLISCVQEGKRSEWNEWIKKERNESEIKLAGADLTNQNLMGFDLMFAHLSGAHLNGASLIRAHLYKAHLYKAHLSGANLRGADLKGANFDADLRYANLEGTIIRNAKLLGTKCCLASVNGQTLITECEINEETDFTGVGLSGSRIDPKLHTQLLRNIRKKQWEKWYVRQLWNYKFFKRPYEPFFKWLSKLVKAVWHMLESLAVVTVVRGFWWVSDYGSSTKRIIEVFFALNGIFTLIYSFIHLLPVTNLQEYTTWPSWLLMSFMQTTLIPFSITEIETENLSFWPMVCVMIHVISGYVILAALVTRFAVMFQDLGP